MKPTALEAIAQARAALDEAERAILDGSTPAVTEMTVEEYAKHRRVSERTVRRWLHEGMPRRKVGLRLVRIQVAQADAWTPPDPESAARVAARRGT